MNDVMVFIDGKSFRCQCGCNVFHKPEPDDEAIYRCNACHTEYRGES